MSTFRCAAYRQRACAQASGALAGLAVTVVLVGCGASGGEVRCGDFKSKDADEQRDTVTKLLEDRDVKTDGLLAGAKISGARLAVQAFCEIQPDDRKIGDITRLGS